MASKTLAAAVERQSGACRALAISLHDHADNSPFVGPAERKILVGYADQIAGISEALTKALKDDDRTALAAIWKWAAPAATLAMAVTVGIAEGVSGGVAEAWTNQKIEQAVDEVMDADNEDAHLLKSVSEPESDLQAAPPYLDEVVASVVTTLDRRGITVADTDFSSHAVSSESSEVHLFGYAPKLSVRFAEGSQIDLDDWQVLLRPEIEAIDHVRQARPVNDGPFLTGFVAELD